MQLDCLVFVRSSQCSVGMGVQPAANMGMGILLDCRKGIILGETACITD
jgi:serine acetyltransferase